MRKGTLALISTALAAVLPLPAQTAKPRTKPAAPPPSPKSAAPAPPRRPSTEEIRLALAARVNVTGTATPGMHRESYGMNSSSWLRWDLDLKLANRAGFPLTLGKDLLLVEANAEGSSFEGIYVARGVPLDGDLDFSSVPDLASPYGLANEDLRHVNGQRSSRRGQGTVSISSYRGKHLEPSKDPEDAGFPVLAVGAEQSLAMKLDQGMWIKDESRASVRIVLPEIACESSTGRVRFRMIVYFDRPAKDKTAWTAARREFIQVTPEELARLFRAPETNPVTRILAANWLAAADPGRLGDVLLPEVRQAKEGPILASSLQLLASTRTAGMEEQSMKLLADKSVPNGIRAYSAKYLGAVKHPTAFASLLGAARDSDQVIARAAIEGIASFGSDESADALLGLLGDKKLNRQHSVIARKLAASASPKTLLALQQAASGGQSEALDALVATGGRGSFEFFRAQLAREKSGSRRNQLIRGLRSSGGMEALPALLALLPGEEPPAKNYPTMTSTLVDEIVALEPPVPELLSLWQAGNLRALQVLAGLKGDAAKPALLDAGRTATGSARQISLEALSRRWPSEAQELFHRALGDADPNVVEIAIRGVSSGGKQAAVPALLPLCSHATSSVRWRAATAIAAAGAGEHAAGIYSTFLASEDTQVAAPLAEALIKAKWSQPGAPGTLAEKLAKAKDMMRFQVIRLLRHLSGDAMGPENVGEFFKDPGGWVEKWRQWASKA